uniref:Uncharacterized protein n=1 Tax=Pseudomonas syringae group genomosp. 3 TaxID=251701 RepID=A0A330JWH5_9PSED|nr:hypothetical protein PSCFBP3800_P200084 [Pseudomonas syringae group genomosp. 3]
MDYLVQSLINNGQIHSDDHLNLLCYLFPSCQENGSVLFVGRAMYQFRNVVFAEASTGKEVKAVSLGFFCSLFNGQGIQRNHFPVGSCSKEAFRVPVLYELRATAFHCRDANNLLGFLVPMPLISTLIFSTPQLKLLGRQLLFFSRKRGSDVLSYLRCRLLKVG